MLLALRRRAFLSKKYEIASGDAVAAWAAKLEKAPLGILERVSPPAGRSFHAGAAAEAWLKSYYARETGKMFVVAEDGQKPPPGAIRLEPPWTDKLEAFPAKTFDFACLLWPGCTARDALRILASRTRPGGTVAALFPLDGSPRLATFLLQRAMKKTKRRTSMTSLGAPRSPGAVRRAAWTCYLGGVRAWADGMHFLFPDGGAAFDAFLRLGGGGIFGPEVDAKTRREIREAFAAEAEAFRTADGIMLTCEFTGVVATR